MTDVRYVIIGDVHSQAFPLKNALDYCYDNNLTPIILGDLFDSQCKISESVSVYNLVRKSQRDLGAIVLRSNHHHLLENLARKENVTLKKDLCRTVREFQEAGVCLTKVGEWLETFPYVFAFRDSHGQEYRVAHAEIPASVEVPNFEQTWMYFHPTEQELQCLLWGADYSLSDRERFWWLGEPEREWVAVAGHYHKVVNDGRSLVLDAGCGGKTRAWYDKRPPALLLYDVEAQSLIEFPAFENSVEG